MRFELKYKITLIKGYFDKGWSLTTYIKYLIALFGLASLNIKATLIVGVIYAFFCYFIGYYWFKYQWVSAEHEVQNRFNPVMKEIRESPIMNGKRKI